MAKVMYMYAANRRMDSSEKRPGKNPGDVGGNVMIVGWP